MSRAIATVERRLLNYKQAATYLGISLRAMGLLASEGKVRKTLIGHRVLFDIKDLDSFVDKIQAAS